MDTDLKNEQLMFIVKQLKDLYRENSQVIYTLRNAEELLKGRNINLSADAIQKVLVDEELNRKNLRVHKIIIENARMLAYQRLMERAGYDVFRAQ